MIYIYIYRLWFCHSQKEQKGKELNLSVYSFQHWSTNWGHCKLKLTININQVKFWFLRRGESKVLRENLSELSREPTNSTHICQPDAQKFSPVSLLSSYPSYWLVTNSHETELYKFNETNALNSSCQKNLICIVLSLQYFQAEHFVVQAWGLQG